MELYADATLVMDLGDCVQVRNGKVYFSPELVADLSLWMSTDQWRRIIRQAQRKLDEQRPEDTYSYH